MEETYQVSSRIIGAESFPSVYSSVVVGCEGDPQRLRGWSWKLQ